MPLFQAGPDDTGVVLFASLATVPLGSTPDPDDRRRIGQKGAERSRRRPIKTGLCGIEPTAYDSDLGRPRAGAMGKVMPKLFSEASIFRLSIFPRHGLHLFLRAHVCIL